jgi:hypothetical protein
MDPLTMGMVAGAVGGVVQGVTGAIGSLVGGGARRREERAAKREYQQAMDAYKRFEFRNPYEALQNTAEDLTVNQQQAQFLAQQQQQGLANTMGALQGAAGGSGIAALAQAMANQQSQNLQQASASIGMQESQIQRQQAAQAQQIQQMQAQGEADIQAAEFGREQTVLGMSQQRLAAARAARQQATQQLVGGIGQIAGGAVELGAMNQMGAFNPAVTKPSTASQQ